MKPIQLFTVLIFFLNVYLMPSQAGAKPISALEAMVTKRLMSEIPSSLGVVSLTLASSVKTLDESSLSFTWKTPPKEGFSDVQLRYTLKNKDHAVWARVELRPYRAVLVAAHELGLGAVVGPGDLVVKKLALRSGEGLTFDPAVFNGVVLKVNVSESQLITEDVVELPPLVARGTELTVLVSLGTLRVATSGTLEQQARSGERSSARLSSGKLVQGLLQDGTTFLVSGGDK